MDFKYCAGCRLDLAPDKFGKRCCAKDGLQWRCKPCHVAAVMRSYHKNPQKKMAYIKKWQADHPE